MEIFYLLHQALLGDVVIQKEFGTGSPEGVGGVLSQEEQHCNGGRDGLHGRDGTLPC